MHLLTFRSSARIGAELHETAFRRLGGSVRVVVLDNLLEGMLTPDIYEPTLNPLYRDVLAHYGAVALPCRVNHPDHKGKVEAGVGHAKRTPLKGQRFESLEAAQAYLDRWETNWADTRIHGTTKRQVATMFAEERPHLLPLPLEPFRFYEYGQRVVHLDGCVEVEAAYYSAPPGWIGRRVQVQWDGLNVRLIKTKVPCADSLGECPREGCSNKNTHDRELNKLKNLKSSDKPIEDQTITQIIRLEKKVEDSGYEQGDSRKVLRDLGEGKQVRVVGYLLAVKQECGESCNCGLQEVDVTTDNHLVLVNPKVITDNPLPEPATKKQLAAIFKEREPLSMPLSLPHACVQTAIRISLATFRTGLTKLGKVLVGACHGSVVLRL